MRPAVFAVLGCQLLVAGSRNTCTAEEFLEDFASALSNEIRQELVADRKPGGGDVELENSPERECPPPRNGFHKRGWIFIPGGDLDRVSAAARDYGEHARIFPNVRQSQVCDASEEGRFRFRYVNQTTVRFSLLPLPKTETTFSEHAAHFGATGVNRKWIWSRSVHVADASRVVDDDLCKLAIADDSPFMRRIETLWIFDRTPGGVSVTVELAMLMRDGLSWYEQKILRDTMNRMTDDTLRAMRDRFRAR